MRNSAEKYACWRVALYALRVASQLSASCSIVARDRPVQNFLRVEAPGVVPETDRTWPPTVSMNAGG